MHLQRQNQKRRNRRQQSSGKEGGWAVLPMKRKEHSEKERELLKKVRTEYEMFRYRMLLCPAQEVYNSCRVICFYECLYEYFRYCEKINRDFINVSYKKEWVLARLWEIYLENEYLKADTWDEIEEILNAYVKDFMDRQKPQEGEE